MASSNKHLTPLQRDLLKLFKEVQGGYVTGGTALSGFLGHRRSLDIDLFVSDAEEVEIAGALLESSASVRGLLVLSLRRSPGFRRYRVVRGDESTLVDLVHEPGPQIVPVEEKPLRDGIRVDSLDDLIANKLCAVLGRSEVKDLVDLYFLGESGVDVLSYLPAAHSKDGGMEPATLAYVLQQMPTDPHGLLLLRDLDPAGLAEFRDKLVARLLELAWPGSR